MATKRYTWNTLKDAVEEYETCRSRIANFLAEKRIGDVLNYPEVFATMDQRMRLPRPEPEAPEVDESMTQGEKNIMYRNWEYASKVFKATKEAIDKVKLEQKICRDNHLLAVSVFDLLFTPTSAIGTKKKLLLTNGELAMTRGKAQWDLDVEHMVDVGAECPEDWVLGGPTPAQWFEFVIPKGGDGITNQMQEALAAWRAALWENSPVNHWQALMAEVLTFSTGQASQLGEYIEDWTKHTDIGKTGTAFLIDDGVKVGRILSAGGANSCSEAQKEEHITHNVHNPFLQQQFHALIRDSINNPDNRTITYDQAVVSARAMLLRYPEHDAWGVSTSTDPARAAGAKTDPEIGGKRKRDTNDQTRNKKAGMDGKCSRCYSNQHVAKDCRSNHCNKCQAKIPWSEDKDKKTWHEAAHCVAKAREWSQQGGGGGRGSSGRSGAGRGGRGGRGASAPVTVPSTAAEA
jgi:hypothetical protein